MIRKASVLLLATIFVAACATTNPDDPNANAKKGAGAGAAAGAILGAIVGNQVGGSRTGAVVGAVLRAAVGASMGHDMDKQQKELQQIPGVEVTRPSQNEIALNLTNDILFDFSSANLRPESRDTLRELADNFSKYPNEEITVEGHTDAIGTPERNQLLSEARAANVRGYLIDNGVPPARISAIGFGDTRPKASNETPEGRQLNRRVEIHIREIQR